MPERTTAPLVDIDDHRNVTELLMRRVAENPHHAAFDVATGDPDAPWRPVSTADYLSEVTALAKGLMATGVEAGDSVAIMAPTRYEWAVADLAVWFAGAVVVPVYDTSSPDQVAAIVADAEVRLAIAAGERQARSLREALDRAAAAHLGVWTMEAGVHDLLALASAGDEVDDALLELRRTQADLDSPATIVYTSGTTGEPKGAVLTHRNFVGQVRNVAAAYREVVHEGGNTVIFLPLAHVLARGLQLVCLAGGMRIAHVADPAEVVGSLAELRPTFLVVVPRVLERIRNAAAAKADATHLGALWRGAVSTATSWATALEAGEHPSVPLRVRRTLFDALFYRRLRTRMGGRLDYILSGGGALDADLSRLFRGIGVPVIEGYGLTETTAPLTGNLPGDIRSGTVGYPLPGSTVRISDQGEILAKGIGIFSGYRDPEHTAEAFEDGFFRTGDLGRLDEDGRVVLEGRLKDVIVTSNGKTVVPQSWESHVETNPLVAHAVMVGEGRSYLSALLVLDRAETGAWAAAQNLRLEEVSGQSITPIAEPRLIAHLQESVDAANARVSRSESVRRFALVFTDLDDTRLVTPTMKIKRRALLERSGPAVEDLYR
ncbi:AMP-dependent synthetase/ligase [Microbacterium aquimaris]|uniref:AMP-dependent synthetase/ligase n=1 Tax=Microbacterium aquimaris TaxID=459816 RepID=A0ABU5N2C2_9MICO|nr:AMP-dependent synthetase/ligase [Microbacterium aquimaris]MDZ8160218.1 AMP-dependent synthetase/ligase [Microbacterium aquimaris]